MKRRPPRKSVKICPQCRSDRLVFEAGLITGQIYHCLNCDYVGSLILEVDADERPPVLDRSEVSRDPSAPGI